MIETMATLLYPHDPDALDQAVRENRRLFLRSEQPARFQRLLYRVDRERYRGDVLMFLGDLSAGGSSKKTRRLKSKALPNLNQTSEII
ncbi:MAG: hypothetical protein ABSH28_14825 [Acidobacteriota bacterium]|jgi:hypothetical protein